MTKREFLNDILNGKMNEELQAFALSEIEKMDAHNAKRASQPSKTALANEPIKQQILELLRDCPMTAPDLAELMEDVSTNKVSALAGQLVTAGKLTVTDVKVPKKGKRKLYTVVDSVEDTE